MFTLVFVPDAVAYTLTFPVIPFTFAVTSIISADTLLEMLPYIVIYALEPSCTSKVSTD